MQNSKNNISKFLSSVEQEDEYAEMYDAALLLDPLQRAMIAQYYYQRVHLRKLGLRVAATCQFHILQRVFGAAAEVIADQSEQYSVTASNSSADQ